MSNFKVDMIDPKGGGRRFRVPFTYSFNQDAVSLNPEITSNGTGALGFTLETEDDWEFYLDETVDGILDGIRFSGRVTEAVETDGHILSLSAAARLSAHFNVEASIPPFNGMVTTYLVILLDRVGLSWESLDFQANLFMVTVPGFTGNVWAHLREFMQVHRLDVYETSDKLVFIESSNSVVVPKHEQSTAVTKTVGFGSTARRVEVTNYNNKWITNGMIYPITDEVPSVITVQAGEIAEIELNLKTSLASVGQPVAVDSLTPNYNPQGTSGRYTVSGADGLPVSAANWRANGGKIEVALKPGSYDTIIVRVVAPSALALKSPDGKDRQSPYSIAMTSSEGSSNAYPTLYLTGTGTQWHEEVVSFETGVNLLSPASELGTTLTNIYVSNLSQTYDIGLRLAQAYCGPDYSQSRNLVRTPDSRVSGGRMEGDAALFKIDSTSFSQSGTSVSATMATTFADFDAVWAGATMGEFGSASNWQGKTFKDLSLKPLRRN